MGFLDDSDSDNGSVSSDDSGDDDKVDVSKYVNSRKKSLKDFEAFKGVDEEEDDVAKKMRELLQLREAMGMDKDVSYLAQQAAKEKEAKRLASMSKEERMEEDKKSSGDMMEKIRAKQEALNKKKKAAEAS